MLNDGVDGFVQGSAYVSHVQACDALIEMLPILVGAAKQNVLIPFTPEQVETMGVGLGKHFIAVTPKNVWEHFNPK
jgi:hypothetical protein